MCGRRRLSLLCLPSLEQVGVFPSSVIPAETSWTSTVLALWMSSTCAASTHHDAVFHGKPKKLPPSPFLTRWWLRVWRILVCSLRTRALTLWRLGYSDAVKYRHCSGVDCTANRLLLQERRFWVWVKWYVSLTILGMGEVVCVTYEFASRYVFRLLGYDQVKYLFISVVTLSPCTEPGARQSNTSQCVAPFSQDPCRKMNHGPCLWNSTMIFVVLCRGAKVRPLSIHSFLVLS